MTEYAIREHLEFFVVETAAGEPGAADKPVAVFASVHDARAFIARRTRKGADAARDEHDAQAVAAARDAPG